MRNEILRDVDKNGRLSVPKDLRELAHISNGSTVAMCKKSSNCVILKSLCNVNDCKIIAITKFDDKGRFVYPKHLLEDDYDQIFEIYVLNGDIHIEEIE